MTGARHNRRGTLALLAGGCCATAVPAVSIAAAASPELAALFADFSAKWAEWEAMDHERWEEEAGPFYKEQVEPLSWAIAKFEPRSQGDLAIQARFLLADGVCDGMAATDQSEHLLLAMLTRLAGVTEAPGEEAQS